MPELLTSRLKSATMDLHVLAERAGIMNDLLRGTIDRAGYCLLLRCLHLIYDELESALASPNCSALRLPCLGRTNALARDLEDLHGPSWRDDILAVPAGVHYALRLAGIREKQPKLLAAHAYVRYMGDLNGGQLLGSIIIKSLGLKDSGTAFYDFSPEDPRLLARRYREALDGLSLSEDEALDLADEAKLAFSMHIAIFEEIAAGL